MGNCSLSAPDYWKKLHAANALLNVYLRLALATILNAKSDNCLLLLAMVCTSFVSINRGTNKRYPYCPLGDERFQSVRDGNLLASRFLGARLKMGRGLAHLTTWPGLVINMITGSMERIYLFISVLWVSPSPSIGHIVNTGQGPWPYHRSKYQGYISYKANQFVQNPMMMNSFYIIVGIACLLYCLLPMQHAAIYLGVQSNKQFHHIPSPRA